MLIFPQNFQRFRFGTDPFAYIWDMEILNGELKKGLGPFDDRLLTSLSVTFPLENY